ncbi:MAG: NAD(P)-dependent glycerol-3-phosphate dehydrogenase [Clostridia bacterium]|nr:NAD(P)-dependent glycerol-3-phosphate dehydrogenase [Clostridia bacterium]
MKTIAIIGSGSWGVALAVHLAKKGNKVKLWSFSDEEAEIINNKRECIFLPDLKIPENVECTLNYEEAIAGSDLILHVTPSKFFRANVKQYKQYVTNQPIIICSKGFELENLSTLDEVLEEELPNAKIGVLSGPSHAEEVSIGVPTALVIASKHADVIELVQNTLASETLRIYSNNDVRGVSIGGALKNIIAFCSGVAYALKLGDNSFAALITRGLSEISRLGEKMGGDKQTFYGLTGLGDLIVTCQSMHSRNRRAGILIGQGKTLEETKQEIGMTIESIDNIEIAYKLAQKYNVEMPITNAVYDVLHGNLKPEDAVQMLMTRKLKAENE